MLYSTLSSVAVLGLTALAQGAELGRRATCSADNCLRNVRATNRPPGPDAASSDCASFFAKTVTPCPSSVTRTVYITSTAGKPLTTTKPPPAATCPSTGSATDIPYYASACPNTSRYSSACSCIGVTTSTTTLASTTTTVTTTSTVTQNGPISTFCNKVILSVVNGLGTPSYVFTSSDGFDLELGPRSSATTYIIEGGGLVDTDAAQGSYLSGYTGGAIYPIYQLTPPSTGFTTLVCSAPAPGNGAFTCTLGGSAYNFVTCPNTSSRDATVLYGAAPGQSVDVGCLVQAVTATAAC